MVQQAGKPDPVVQAVPKIMVSVGSELNARRFFLYISLATVRTNIRAFFVVCDCVDDPARAASDGEREAEEDWDTRLSWTCIAGEMQAVRRSLGRIALQKEAFNVSAAPARSAFSPWQDNFRWRYC
jgi:hypothetical protein